MAHPDDFEAKLRKLPPAELVVLRWEIQRRPNQTPPDPLPYIWFLLGGRGSGKTLTGSNHIFQTAKELPHTPKTKIVRVALVSETFKDVRNTMIEGATGLRSIIPRDLEINYNRTNGEYKFALPGPPYREVHCFAFSSERPDDLRGPAHHIAWVDEPAKLKDADKEPTAPSTTWSNLVGGLRESEFPHIIVTGTPEPNRLVKYLLNHPKTVLHKMSSMENTELPEDYLDEFRRLPPTSRTYRQEVLAEVLFDNPDSIIAQELIDDNREDPIDIESLNLVLGWDPSMSASDESDETGIIVTGYLVNDDKEIHAFPLYDLSGHLNPSEQGKTIADALISYRIPDAIIEQNQGSGYVQTILDTAIQNHSKVKELVRREKKKKPTKAGTMKLWKYTITFNDNSPPLTINLHMIQAKVSKITRVDMVAPRYELKQVHHPVQGFPICHIPTCAANVEDQLVLWSADKKDSPDRMDALVYTLIHIFGPDKAFSTTRAATLHTTQTANAQKLPSYDPRTTITRLKTTPNRHSSVYNVDLGGNSAQPNRPRVAGPRRIPIDTPFGD